MLSGMKKCLVSVLTFTSLLILSSRTAHACPTTFVKLRANLNPSDPISENFFGTLAELEAASGLSGTLTVYDRSGVSHLLYLFYFHQVARPDGWRVHVYVDPTDIAPLPYDVPQDRPTLFFNHYVTFVGDNTRFSIFERVGTIRWANGNVSKLEFDYTGNESMSSSSQFSVKEQNGSAIRCTNSATSDFDGDTVDDFTTFDRGVWTIHRSTQLSNPVRFQFGVKGDQPFVGDYTGDGIADIAVWRPSNGTWYLCETVYGSVCANVVAYGLGLRDDRPLRADFDGDGQLDFSVFRPSTGSVYTHFSSTAFVGALPTEEKRTQPVQGGPR